MMRINLLKSLPLWLLLSCSWFVHAQQISQDSQLTNCDHQPLPHTLSQPQDQALEAQAIKTLVEDNKNINGKPHESDIKLTCDVNETTPLALTSDSNSQTQEPIPQDPLTKEITLTEETSENSSEIPAATTEEELKGVEKKLEQERLKVLFVDVNSVVENVGSTMDWTANYLDSFFAKNELGKDKAKTWGHFVMGWEPREGEVFTGSSFPIKFKVKAKLPNLENKVEIILSDGEDDDFQTLPYESVRPEAFKLSQSSLGAAVRFLHTKSDNVSSSVRIGWGEDQLYTRASATYRKKLFNDKVIFNVQPAIEYYVVDGWGARFLLDTGLKLDEKAELRYNFSLRDLESFDSSEWRSGLFHISSVGDKAALIVGLSSFGYVEPKPDAEQHRFSIRYRFNALRSWVFFEIEPFFELHKVEPSDENWNNVIYSDFVRDSGISLRFEAHYGFL